MNRASNSRISSRQGPHCFNPKTLTPELDMHFIGCSVFPGLNPTSSVLGSSGFTRDLFPHTTGDQVHEADSLGLLQLVCFTNTLPCMHGLPKGKIKSSWPQELIVYHVVFMECSWKVSPVCPALRS